MSKSFESGYVSCACRDCMEIAIGAPGAFCHECEDAGCEGERECQAAEAYGGEPEEAPAVSAVVEVTGALIRARCEHAGFFVVSEGTQHPALIIERLLEALRALAAGPCRLPLCDAWIDATPEAARSDERHAYWDSDLTTEALTELMVALCEVAPPGFTFANEGPTHRLGFFRC